MTSLEGSLGISCGTRAGFLVTCCRCLVTHYCNPALLVGRAPSVAAPIRRCLKEAPCSRYIR